MNRQCVRCGTEFPISLTHPRKRFCTERCRKTADKENYPVFVPTPLNDATSAAYATCAHRAGNELTVTRPYMGHWVQMPVCEGCGVPIAGAWLTFSLTGTRPWEDAA